jgi:hypothetical protein
VGKFQELFDKIDTDGTPGMADAEFNGAWKGTVVKTYTCHSLVPATTASTEKLGEKCLIKCSNKAGPCPGFCGKGLTGAAANKIACCKYGDPTEPVECENAVFTEGGLSGSDHFCVEVIPPATNAAASRLNEECFSACGGKSGKCSFCGKTADPAPTGTTKDDPRACCRQGFVGDGIDCTKAKYTDGLLSSQHHLCVDLLTTAPKNAVHLGVECWGECGSKSGKCPQFCGNDGATPTPKDYACCRHGFDGDAAECRSGIFTGFESQKHHICVELA